MTDFFTRFAALGRGLHQLRKNTIGVLLLAASVLPSPLLLGINNAEAAMPGKIADMEGILPDRSNLAPTPPAEAIQAISGSPYPGVIDCLLQRALPEESRSGTRADIHINYPSFGNKVVDEDIRGWVSDMAEAFANHLEITDSDPRNALDNADAIIDSFLNDDTTEPPDETPRPYELWGAYRVSRPSSAAVSIAFELWNYTGDPEGNLDIITLNYSLLTGQRLDFVDIFEKPDVALELMSTWARKMLEPRLGATMRSRMLTEGTEPLVENFSSITLIPEGICINFQPWQVAPRDAGIQKVVMPLEELLPSSPLLALWGKGEKSNEHTGLD